MDRVTTEERIIQVIEKFQTNSQPNDATLAFDSITFIKVIVALEDEFGIQFDVDKIDIENFKTIQELAKYTESKLQAKES